MPQVRIGSLVDRVRIAMANVGNVEEKKMFGSVAFMVGGKLCLSARESWVMCKVDPALQPDLVMRTGVRPMVTKGRELKGYVYVDERALRTEKDLRYWVSLALDAVFMGSGKAERQEKGALI